MQLLVNGSNNGGGRKCGGVDLVISSKVVRSLKSVGTAALQHSRARRNSLIGYSEFHAECEWSTVARSVRERFS